MTLDEAKQLIAEKHNFKSWERLEVYYKRMGLLYFIDTLHKEAQALKDRPFKIEVGKTYEKRKPEINTEAFPATIKITKYNPDRFFKFETDIPWLSFTELGRCTLEGTDHPNDLVREV